MVQNQNTCTLVSTMLEIQNDLYGKRKLEKSILLTLYGVLIVSGVIGNSLVIWIISRSPRLRNTRNYFIVHLACSDLLLCLLTAPSTLYLTLYAFWTLGDFTCKMVASLQALNTFLSSLTLTAIALDRYLLVIFPIKWRNKKKSLIFILSSVWIMSIVVSAPYFFVVGAIPVSPWNTKPYSTILEDCDMVMPRFCVEKFDGSNNWFDRKTFTILIFVLQYIFPLSALLFVYWKIGTTATNRRPSTRLQNGRQVERNENYHQRRRRTQLLLTSLVTVFGICWLPNNLYLTLNALDVVNFSQSFYIYLHLIGMATTFLNPLLYGFFNGNLQEVAQELLRKRRRKRKLLLSFRNQKPAFSRGQMSLRNPKTVARFRQLSRSLPIEMNEAGVGAKAVMRIDAENRGNMLIAMVRLI